eukprot:TRINITY_DN10196_c0_g1_i1.p1 TRINITY_DN10196_c0_g1~~TRINITY_DN10196_c0_g1_i1.p1  ORF type:complete len:1062 (+),score=170.23 TRINITY_DN10196_c0_g1_i1:32-3187(+)
MSNFDFVPTASETAIEKARREREQRARLRLVSEAACRVQRCWRRFHCLRAAQVQCRTRWDDTTLALYPDDTSRKACTPPPSTNSTLSLVRAFVWFFDPFKEPADNERLLLLCRIVLSSVACIDAPKNYCFLAVPVQGDTVAAQWMLQTRRFLNIVLRRLRCLAAEASKSAELCLLLRTVLQLTEHKNWAFICIRGKPPNQLSPQEESVIAVLTRFAATATGELLRACVTNGMFEILGGFFVGARHAAVVTQAVATLAIRPVLLFARECLRSASVSVASDFASNFLCVPYLPSLVDQAAKQLLQHPAVLENVLALQTLREMDAPKLRHLVANLVELSGTAAPSDAASDPSWVSNMCKLIALLPEGKPDSQAESQLATLWAPQTVRRLFADLFDVTSKMTSPIPAATVSTKPKPAEKVKEFFSRKKNAADILKRTELEYQAETAVATLPPWAPACELYNKLVSTWNPRPILMVLAFRRPYLVTALWLWLSSLPRLLHILSENIKCLPAETAESIVPPLLLFCHIYHFFLLVCDGAEFYEQQNPFGLTDVARIADILNRLSFQLFATTEKLPTNLENLRDASRNVIVQLSDRQSRRPFCPAAQWILADTALWQRTMGQSLASLASAPPDSPQRTRLTAVVRNLSHTVPFHVRVQLFRSRVEEDKARHNATNARVPINIRRQFVVEDGVAEFAKIPERDLRLKAKLFVQFKNQQGMDEAGIDAGGLFKEFVTEVVKRAFDPRFGLFTTTDEENPHLYPNPNSGRLHSEVGTMNHLRLFTFLGRIAAKALYEGIVADLRFADFFLNFLLGKGNLVEDLSSLDPALYKNLLFLKTSSTPVEDLCLSFCIEEDVMGEQVKYDLIPNGEATDVTGENLTLYIFSVADFKLNRRIQNQTRAFLAGFFEIIQQEWLRMFSREELQRLIGGDNCEIDLADLQRHTKYAGGYSADHRIIKNLWKTLEEFDQKQRGRFLQFVTSCPKPPMLGFVNLHPPFCIRMADDGERGEGLLQAIGIKGIDRLPSASTCFNLLKLPPYATRSQLKEKLLYAINAGAGFELS